MWNYLKHLMTLWEAQIIIVKSHEKKMTNTIHCLVSITTPGQFLKQQEFGFLHNFSIILKRAREKKMRQINYKIVFIPSCKSKVTVFQRRCRRLFVNLQFFLPHRRMHYLSAFPQVWKTSSFLTSFRYLGP